MSKIGFWSAEHDHPEYPYRWVHDDTGEVVVIADKLDDTRGKRGMYTILWGRGDDHLTLLPSQYTASEDAHDGATTFLRLNPGGLGRKPRYPPWADIHIVDFDCGFARLQQRLTSASADDEVQRRRLKKIGRHDKAEMV